MQLTTYFTAAAAASKDLKAAAAFPVLCLVHSQLVIHRSVNRLTSQYGRMTILFTMLRLMLYSTFIISRNELHRLRIVLLLRLAYLDDVLQVDVKVSILMGVGRRQLQEVDIPRLGRFFLAQFATTPQLNSYRPPG